MKNISLIFTSFFLTLSMYASENVGFRCAHYFASIQANLKPDLINDTVHAIAYHVKHPSQPAHGLPVSQDSSMQKVFDARLKAVKKFYSLIKKKKIVPTRVSLSQLAYDLEVEDHKSAKYLLEDSGDYAGAAVQLALWELEK